MSKKAVYFLMLFAFIAFTQAQNPYPYTPEAVRMQGFKARMDGLATAPLARLSFDNIGPTVMSGRVVDVDVNPDDPSQFYLAYASGSVWFTASNGSKFSPVFDDQATPTIGDIAVDWKRNTIWVGTGENNSSRSSYAGTGVYKSTDGGKTWQHLGLAETHHTGRIVLHPSNPNVAWVGAIGHLYSANPERGLFKTTDGGKTWRKTLFIDENTGVIDVALDPTNPNTLYAAAWYRTRRAWNFEESGKTSGIYKSTDGGETWTLLTTAGKGFPTGEGVGRIGLSVVDGKTILAVLDNQDKRPKGEPKPEEGLTRDTFRHMEKSAFLQLKKEALKTFLEKNRFPKEYDAETVMNMIKTDQIKPQALVEYLEDANTLLLDGSPIIGCEVYRSEDGGKTWRKTHPGYIEDMFSTYGYYFGQIRHNATKPSQIYILGVLILRSDDGGKTWVNINGDNVHLDHHALWVNPKREGHLINGNDGGINISYDNGDTWYKANAPAVGQFYAISYDMAQPYNVYGGLQDNGVWTGPSTYKATNWAWHDSGHYPYKNLYGGDGMQVQVDFRDNNTVYTGLQFGNYSRVNRSTGEAKPFRLRHKLGERPLRFNWQAPIHLSRFNQDIVYFGANKVFRSMDKGENWEAISGDLTKGGKAGDVPYGTLTSIEESPLQFGLLYAGSDDGYIHISKDGGVNWERISDALPANLWVSRVRPSRFDKATVYATLNGYRWDHFEAYVYKSTDYGQTWERMGKNLPAEPVNVITEDLKNPSLLFVGTDLGLYVSLDGGKSFSSFQNGLPHTPVHDVVIHPREGDLLVGTHGRSIYKADLKYIRQLDSDILAKDLHFFVPEKLTWSDRWGKKGWSWGEAFVPQVALQVYAKTAGDAQISVKNAEGKTLKSWRTKLALGLNTLSYDASVEAVHSDIKPAENGVAYLPEGTYSIEVRMNNTTATEKLGVKKREDR